MSNEILITPEMIEAGLTLEMVEAGVQALWDSGITDDPLEADRLVVVRIFLAMKRAAET